MQKKTIIAVVGVLFALILLAGACSAGFVAGRTFDGMSASSVFELPFSMEKDLVISPTGSDELPASNTPQDREKLFEPFWQAWDQVNELFVDQPIDQVALMRGAIKGMMEALGDQHSSYLDPEMLKRSIAMLEGSEYEGIGAWVDPTQDYLTVISPMPGSPAEKAGLRSGDKVIAIDGEDMTGKGGEYARQLVLGPKGTVVKLTILRQGVAEPFDVDVQRAEIVTPSVAGRMLDDNNIAYLQLFTFGDSTYEETQKALKDLLAQNPDGLILDMRNNGGGYRDTAVEVASQFIDDGTIMFEEFGDGRREAYKALRDGLATEIPMVVLVNEGSASASEIVAGAIQDYERGYLVGEQSYGKGSVQQYVTLDNDQGAVRITVARWLTPLGRQIHEIGLRPDFPVEITEEDLAAGRDPQLDQAIQVLLQKLTPPPTPVASPTLESTPVATPYP
jgi:carboxyl-terminal processing protease